MGIISRIYKVKIEEERAYKDKALRAAKKIASVLAKKFGAKKVILFGSLCKGNIFDAASDIDLVVEGLGKGFLKAYGYCLRMSDFTLDIKDYQDLPQEIKKDVECEGRILYG